MLTDREQETWREIQHQLVHDLDWTRTVHSVERRAPGDHHRLTHPGTVLAAMTLIVALLVGPNPLTRTELAARQQSPEPNRASLLSEPAAAVEYLTGVEWAPAREIPGLLGPTNTSTVHPQDAVLSPASRIAPSAAA
jgi:hypothetical protein